MPNIASAIRSEISRIARKEGRQVTGSLKNASASYRSDIATLKRRLAALESQVRKLGRTTGQSVPTPSRKDTSERVRFNAKGFGSHRKKLGLSAAQTGALLAVSPLTVYHWESGKAKPRARHMPRIAAFRGLGKKQAAAAIAQVMG